MFVSVRGFQLPIPSQVMLKMMETFQLKVDSVDDGYITIM